MIIESSKRSDSTWGWEADEVASECLLFGLRERERGGTYKRADQTHGCQEQEDWWATPTGPLEQAGSTATITNIQNSCQSSNVK